MCVHTMPEWCFVNRLQFKPTSESPSISKWLVADASLVGRHCANEVALVHQYPQIDKRDS